VEDNRRVYNKQEFLERTDHLLYFHLVNEVPYSSTSVKTEKALGIMNVYTSHSTKTLKAYNEKTIHGDWPIM
jgi:hypothetical protein